ncbi:MAG: hypothetical protein CMM50_13160 [Rhodospirillaceae bacterium]|nr:hypothetical protein [Rhodospirillaceae bacterium]
MKLLTVLLALLVFPAVLAAQESSDSRGLFRTEDLWIDSGGTRHHFSVEIADTRQKRSLGLMFREDVPPGTGMLFDFEEPRDVAMWMKNTYVPLDMLFIGANGTILNIAADTTPLSLEPIHSAGQALAVLELDGGTAEKLGIRAGDRVEHPLFTQ